MILSSFHAFKNRKFLMKFVVGSYTRRSIWFPGTAEKQRSDHWHCSTTILGNINFIFHDLNEGCIVPWHRGL